MMEIYENGECKNRIFLASLSYQKMGWGPHNKMLMPAVKIMADGKKLMTIGLLSATERWSDHKKYIQATDYMVESKIVWKNLLAELKNTMSRIAPFC